jgi:IS605 OrfB family transposase
MGIRTLLQDVQSLEGLYRDWGRLTTKGKDGVVRATDKYTGDSVASLLPGSGSLDIQLGGTLKESIIRNTAWMIASYVSGSENTGYPIVSDPSPAGLGDVLKNFASVGADLGDENNSRSLLLKRMKSNFHPILFSRARDVRILMDRDRGRFFVFLSNILPTDSDLVSPVSIDQDNLIDINTGEVFRRKSKGSLLCPIEIGRSPDCGWGWQYERFILPTLMGECNIKQAYLTKQDEDYYLNVSFVFNDIPTYEPQSFLGIDRGIVFTMAYGIVGLNGQILKTHSEDDGYRQLQIDMGLKRQKWQKAGKAVTVRHFKRQALESVLHRLVNSILDEAIYYQSAIVLEDLNIRVKGKWIKSAFSKIDKIIRYKAALRGVPVYGHVFAAKSSMICIHCGELVERKKDTYQTVTCLACGHIEHSDEAAGVNIARRALYRKKDWKGGYLEFHKSFANAMDNQRKNQFAKTSA